MCACPARCLRATSGKGRHCGGACPERVRKKRAQDRVSCRDEESHAQRACSTDKCCTSRKPQSLIRPSRHVNVGTKSKSSPNPKMHETYLSLEQPLRDQYAVELSDRDQNRTARTLVANPAVHVLAVRLRGGRKKQMVVCAHGVRSSAARSRRRSLVAGEPRGAGESAFSQFGCALGEKKSLRCAPATEVSARTAKTDIPPGPVKIELSKQQSRHWRCALSTHHRHSPSFAKTPGTHPPISPRNCGEKIRIRVFRAHPHRSTRP